MKEILYRGCDISTYQTAMSVENYKGLDFVIIRAGYGKYIKQKDTMFENHYKSAKAAGLYVGAYWYGYATTPQDAEKEAEICAQVLAGKSFEMPIYYDVEERAFLELPKQSKETIIRAFCTKMEQYGYFCGVYTSRSAIQAIGDAIPHRFALWVAEWGVDSPKYPENLYGMWQYTDKGKLNNKTGKVDLDFCFIDYPKAIKESGLNNCLKETPILTNAQKLYEKYQKLTDAEKRDFKKLLGV